jgi:hypothetical protein
MWHRPSVTTNPFLRTAMKPFTAVQLINAITKAIGYASG